MAASVRDVAWTPNKTTVARAIVAKNKTHSRAEYASGGMMIVEEFYIRNTRRREGCGGKYTQRENVSCKVLRISDILRTSDTCYDSACGAGEKVVSEA